MFLCSFLVAQEIWRLQHQVLSKASLLLAVFPPVSQNSHTWAFLQAAPVGGTLLEGGGRPRPRLRSDQSTLFA